MGYELNNDFSVINNWNELEGCCFSEKRWVVSKNTNIENIDSLEGMFLSVWCSYDMCWCSAEHGYDSCTIYCDHRDE